MKNMIISSGLINLRKNWQGTYLSLLKIKKIEHPYFEPQVQDSETIKIESKKEEDEFFDLKQKFNAIGNAATEQKKQNDLIE